jgi:hypothetical protein
MKLTIIIILWLTLMIIGNHEALPGNTHVSSVQTDLKYQLKIFILTMKVTVIILAAIRV